jgi:hypothetical protein
MIDTVIVAHSADDESFSQEVVVVVMGPLIALRFDLEVNLVNASDETKRALRRKVTPNTCIRKAGWQFGDRLEGISMRMFSMYMYIL